MLLPLQKGILYGPIDSRRLGKSLGINLMPSDFKLCSFNCVYCHYGWTRKHTLDFHGFHKDLPTIDAVVRKVEEAAKSKIPFDFLTFSGNGEPSLHPHFTELVEQVIRIRDKWRPRAKIALLSNSSGLLHEKVRGIIAKIDMPVFKLDAGAEVRFKEINRPARGIDFDEIVNLLSSLQEIYIQTVLVQGTPSNVGKEDIASYFQQLSRIQPQEAHIYSIDRPVPKAQIRLVPPKRLEQIAIQGQKETGVKIKSFYLR